MHYLLATDSVHTTAAGCDYLLERLADGDRVTVLSVTGPGTDDRDAGDAANVATARLTGLAELETETREGDPTTALLDAVDSHAPDVLLVGPHGGVPGKGPEMGETARAVVERVSIPVVVLPIEALS